MKKCPYCAEQIQDAATVCRYCGRDVPAAPARPETYPAVTLIAFLGFLATYYILAVMVEWFWPDANTGYQVLGLLEIFFRVAAGVLAVRDRFPGGGSFGKQGLVFLLAFLPIGSWFADYYAARTISRAIAPRLLSPATLLTPQEKPNTSPPAIPVETPAPSVSADVPSPDAQLSAPPPNAATTVSVLPQSDTPSQIATGCAVTIIIMVVLLVLAALSGNLR